MIYRVKPGNNVALVSLETFDPQPHCLGLQYTRVTMTAARSSVLEGAFFVLEWDTLTGDETEYQAHLTRCGLSSAMQAPVTVTGPDINYGEARYNAIAHKPIPGQDIRRANFFIGGVGILFTDLVAL